MFNPYVKSVIVKKVIDIRLKNCIFMGRLPHNILQFEGFFMKKFGKRFNLIYRTAKYDTIIPTITAKTTTTAIVGR